MNARINPVQRESLRVILPHVRNERRLAVIAAFSGIRVRELKRAVGLVGGARDRASDAAWIGRAWKLAQVIGLDFTELWELDGECHPERWFAAHQRGMRKGEAE